MSFAGVSVVAAGRLRQPSAEPAKIYAGSSAAGSGSWYHLLVADGFSRIKHLPAGQCIKGCSFRAGGYPWALWFYPNGDHPDDAGFVSVFLVLDQEHVEQPVKAHAWFSFIDELDKQDPAFIRSREAIDFNTSELIWGWHRSIKVEHLKGGCFTIRCDFIIAEAATAPLIEVPPSNMSEHLNHLFVTKLGADVTFEVGHETFTAHRCVLASRSSVFMAELFGPMKEGIATAGAIQIQDMEPNIFKSLLHFIYTDSMPKMEPDGEAEREEAGDEVMWLQHLLAAADKYDLQRLKSMCEKRLSRRIDLSSVLSIINLAAQHHCRGLKEACLEFLKVQSGEDFAAVADLCGDVAVEEDPDGLGALQLLENLISSTLTSIRKPTDDQGRKGENVHAVMPSIDFESKGNK
ncbi:BTB/POZ and MATH domain-containing protein 2-like [Triticum dicoccoides]|uniref:BTB/POZ and MATH domain-containing protein 2-like n=1 Tax=Triticum dicoccoides TaxID=85692 RepID=UPI0018905F46|nr:BTB/POZ and MATH domain-containing protein 2-like [Triticum dicoccoides]